MARRVAFQGEYGAYSEAAAQEMFSVANNAAASDDGIDTVPCTSFDDVFTALIDGNVQFAVVPIENTLGGSIHANYDLLLRHTGVVHIVGEHSFRVRHALLAGKGVTKDKITAVMSHPQAIAQCDGYIRRHGWERKPAYDTAGSAKAIVAESLRTTAAICGVTAAKRYGLDVLDSGIEDDTNNYTRFLLLSKVPFFPPDGIACKTTVVFQPSTNEAGLLFKALSVFALRDIDLCKIESRPGRRLVTQTTTAPAEAEVGSKRRRVDTGTSASSSPQFLYTFYVDFLAHANEERVDNALRHLAEISPFVKVLGCFPANGIILGTGEGSQTTTATLEATGPGKPPTVSVQRTFPLNVGIVGYGNFGQFLAAWFAAAGHRVVAASRSDYSEVAKTHNVGFYRSPADMLRTARQPAPPAA